MSSENNLGQEASVDQTSSVNTIIEDKISQIKLKFNLSKEDLAEETVDQFIQELTGYLKIVKLSIKTEACSEESCKSKYITELISDLSQHKNYLKNKRQVFSKLIDLETAYLKNKALWDQSRFEKCISQGIRISKDLLLIVEELERMIDLNPCKERVEALIQNCRQMLRDINLTITKLNEFDNQYSLLQKQHEAILQDVKSTNDPTKALEDLEELKLRAKNLHEVNSEAKDRKHSFLCSIDQDIEKFTAFVEIESSKKELNNLLKDFVTAWCQIKHNLSVKTYPEDSLKDAEKTLNKVRLSIDESAKELREKMKNNFAKTNIEEVKQTNVAKLQCQFFDIKAQVRASNMEDDGSEFITFAIELKKLQSRIVDDPSLLKEVEKYYQAIEKEAGNLSYLAGIEAKVDEIENLISSEADIKLIEKELHRLTHILPQNTFTTLIDKIEQRKNRLINRIKKQAFDLEKLQGKMRREKIKADETLTKIEDELKTIEAKVRSFVGLKNEGTHYELSETITGFIIQLDTIKIKNEEVKEKKIYLLKKLQELADLLARRSDDAEEFFKFYTEVDDMLVFVKFGEGDLNGENFQRIKKMYTNLRYERDFMQISDNDEITKKLNDCDKKLILVENFIKEKEASAQYCMSSRERKTD